MWSIHSSKISHLNSCIHSVFTTFSTSTPSIYIQSLKHTFTLQTSWVPNAEVCVDDLSFSFYVLYSTGWRGTAPPCRFLAQLRQGRRWHARSSAAGQGWACWEKSLVFFEGRHWYHFGPEDCRHAACWCCWLPWLQNLCQWTSVSDAGTRY